MMNQSKQLILFRKIALLEGWSFIILLFIAMPLKYMFDMPLAVKYVGWAHGALFVVYMILLLKCWIELNWKFIFVFTAFISAIIPFATFALEKKLSKL
jgi:integral membrane protein